jgi:hypothetical protein
MSLIPNLETPSASDILRKWPVLGVLVGALFGLILGALGNSIVTP